MTSRFKNKNELRFFLRNKMRALVSAQANPWATHGENRADGLSRKTLYLLASGRVRPTAVALAASRLVRGEPMPRRAGLALEELPQKLGRFLLAPLGGDLHQA